MALKWAVIGGSGLYHLSDDFKSRQTLRPNTAYGQVSADLQVGDWQGHELAFLPRHGVQHQTPPHRINYRANLRALHDLGVSNIIAVNAVGGINPDCGPQTIVLPDQIIDYSSNREHSFFDGEQAAINHIDFTWPYSQRLRGLVSQAAFARQIELVEGGVYGCTNGPRLETAAEIRKMKADGCDIIGMTGMPEAALARELEIEYVSIALVVNWCAGLDNRVISMDDIKAVLTQGLAGVRELILATLEHSKA